MPLPHFQRYLVNGDASMMHTLDVLVVVVSSPHQSPRCGVWRVEKDWKLWLPTVSVGDPAAKRQLPFGLNSQLRELTFIYLK